MSDYAIMRPFACLGNTVFAGVKRRGALRTQLGIDRDVYLLVSLVAFDGVVDGVGNVVSAVDGAVFDEVNNGRHQL